MVILLIRIRRLSVTCNVRLCSPCAPVLMLLSFMLLALAACGPRVDAGTTATTATNAPLVLDLPALSLTYDTAGVAYIGTVPAAELGPALGIDLSRVNLTPDQIGRLQAANLQHIQFSNTPAGLLIFVNGRRVPSLVWDEAVLQLTAETLATLGPSAQLVSELVPLATQVGGGLLLRFPVATGATPLALQVTADEERFTATRQTQAAYLAIVGSPPPLTVTVDYQPDGSWTVAGLTGEQWAAAMPLPWTRLNLPPDLVQDASHAGIVSLLLTTNQQGLFIEINGRGLPYISWADGELANLVTLAADTGLLANALGANPHTDTLLATIQALLPIVATTPVELRVNFPQP